MRYVDWLPAVYEVALELSRRRQGTVEHLSCTSRLRRPAHGGVWRVRGMSKYSPAQRFDQHKAGIRAAGSVLKRGLEVLTGPTLHLQSIKRRRPRASRRSWRRLWPRRDYGEGWTLDTEAFA